LHTAFPMYTSKTQFLPYTRSWILSWFNLYYMYMLYEHFKI